MDENIGERLDQYLTTDAVDRLRTYFSGEPFRSGRRFERLAGGGDRLETENQFTADDLVAVSMLGVAIHPDAAIRILEDDAAVLAQGLTALPNGADLWDVPAQTVDQRSEAHALWDRLDAIPKVGPVIAGKLLARKRPRLIPVYDTVIEGAIGAKDKWWISLRAALQDPARQQKLRDLRSESEIGDDISLLRVLDVAIWMTGGTPPSPSLFVETL